MYGIGLEAAGVVIGDGATILALGDVRNNTILLSLIGIVITGILVARKVKGALFLGMIITTIIGIPMGVIELPNSIISMPPSISSTFMKFEWHNIFSFDMVIVLFTLLFMDMFDTIGTLVGVATKANMLDENAKILLPHFSCHSLRHTFTTRMCEAGVNVKVIQDTLGHKDISTTLNIYTDVTKELRRSEFEGLDSYFKNEYNKAANI